MNLLRGHELFKENKKDKFIKKFKQFENGQSPHTLFITCADSRIDPHLITNCEPGELFVVRNAGNFVASKCDMDREQSLMSTIEYAMNILNIKNVVVCGHSDCGAIKALGGDLSNTVALRNYIPKLKMDNSECLNSMIKENVINQVEKLKDNDHFNQNGVTYNAWVYDVVEGEIVDLAKEKENV